MTDRRWAWVEVDLDAVRHNVRTLRSLIPSNTAFMAVVKADAYGHGAVSVARAAVEEGVEWLGVATVDEALELRTSGIAAPILMFSEPPVSAIPELLENRVVPTVFSTEFVDALSAAASARGVTAPVHLKVDTGMHRIGVAPDHAVAFARRIVESPGLELGGVFTHFATADVEGDADAALQLERFCAVTRAMREADIDPGVVHAANSAATILIPAAAFDMVRVGISLYGLEAFPGSVKRAGTRPVMSVKSRAISSRRVEEGEGVGYGLTWRAPAAATILTLPLGYADGVHRLSSNRMEVLVDGVRARQVGRVCMDQLMVLCPDSSNAGPGTECVLVGAQGEDGISCSEAAAWAETIDYELACAFGARLERVYLG